MNAGFALPKGTWCKIGSRLQEKGACSTVSRTSQHFAMNLEPLDGIPWSLHNLWVALLILLIAAWLLQVLYRLVMAQVILCRMRRASERGIFLDRMSFYASNLQEIIRQHFNQLLRIRPAVPARDVAQLKVSVHLQPESLRCSEVLVDGLAHLQLSFLANSLEPFHVMLWDERRCNSWIDSFMREDSPNQFEPSDKLRPAGCGQEVAIGTRKVSLKPSSRVKVVNSQASNSF